MGRSDVAVPNEWTADVVSASLLERSVRVAVAPLFWLTVPSEVHEPAVAPLTHF
jgi:hypothetical protein